MIRAALALSLLASPAMGQTYCGDRALILDSLKTKHGETQRAIMLMGPRIVEVYASEAGSWTIIVTVESGAVCILGMGDNYRDSPAKPLGEPL